MIRGIHHIAINTPDIERLAGFYRDAFGFVAAAPLFEWSGDEKIDRTIGVQNSAAKALMLRAGNCHIELFQYRQPESQAGSPLRPFDRGYTHFCIDVTDIGAEYDRLAALGMTFTQDRPSDFGDIKAVYGYDPDGNLVEIQEVEDKHPFALP